MNSRKPHRREKEHSTNKNFVINAKEAKEGKKKNHKTNETNENQIITW